MCLKLNLKFRGRFENFTTVSEYLEVMKGVVSRELKMAMPCTNTFLPYIENGYRSGVSSLRIIKDRLDQYFLGMVFYRFSPFYETFDGKIVQLFESASVIHSKIFNRKKFKSCTHGLAACFIGSRGRYVTQNPLWLLFLPWSSPTTRTLLDFCVSSTASRIGNKTESLILYF